MAEKLTIKIDGDIKDYKQKIGQIEGFNAKIGDKLKTVAKGAAIAFAGLTGAVTLAVNEARKIETITTQFEVLTGSAERASKLVKDLQEFSASTPFQFEGIAKASQQLLGFGFNADQIPDKLQQIGDVASAVNRPIEEVGFIFGQISAAGKLTGERLLQLQERAIPIGPALAKTMGVAEESIRDLVSQGKVDFETFEKAFASLSDEGSIAFGGMEKQSKTLDGRISTLKDNVSLLAADMGKELLPVVKELTDQLLGFVQSLRDSESFLNLVKGTISLTSKVILNLSEGFETLGKRIGAIIATVSEAVTAALNLNFKQAVEVFKTNDKAFREDLLALQKSYADKSKAIDEALYSDREQKRAIDSEKEVNAEKEKQQKLDEIKQAQKEKEQEEFENALGTLEELELAKTEKELELLQDRIDRKAEQDEIKKIQELEREGEHAKALEEIEKLRDKKRLKQSEEFVKKEKMIKQSRLQAAQNFLTAGAQIAKQGSETQKNLQVANAAISTYTAANQALSSPPGPPWTIPLSASIVAMGLANVAQIKGVKFAEGGIYKGGIPGVDSIPSMVQRNEIIAPTSSFDEVVEGTARQRGFVREDEAGGEGGMVTVVLEPKGDLREFIEQQIVEARIQNRGIL